MNQVDQNIASESNNRLVSGLIDSPVTNSEHCESSRCSSWDSNDDSDGQVISRQMISIKILAQTQISRHNYQHI